MDGTYDITWIISGTTELFRGCTKVLADAAARTVTFTDTNGRDVTLMGGGIKMVKSS